jgi:hypothetical protein
MSLLIKEKKEKTINHLVSQQGETFKEGVTKLIMFNLKMRE